MVAFDRCVLDGSARRESLSAHHASAPSCRSAEVGVFCARGRERPKCMEIASWVKWKKAFIFFSL